MNNQRRPEPSIKDLSLAVARELQTNKNKHTQSATTMGAGKANSFRFRLVRRFHSINDQRGSLTRDDF